MEEETPAVVEDVQVEGENEVPNKKIRHRKKELYKSIKMQMEFYFSDANITKDRFLGKLIAEDKHVEISIFIQFNKIRALTTNVKDIADALRNSELLSVTEDGTKVFRTTPLKEKYNTDDCTIYVEQLPPDAQHDWLKSIFSAYGKVAYVSIPKYRTSGKIKGFAFVEFDTPEEANKTLEAFSARGCRLSSQIAPEKLCSITTYEPDEGKSKNLPNETDKEDISEKINEEEDGQFQDGLLKKNKKRKKSKQEHGEEMSIEESEVIATEGNKDGVETEDNKDGDMPLKKLKRKKTQDTEIEAELGTGHAQVEDENSPPKKKKRKKSEGTAVGETEEKKDTADVDTSSVHQPDDTEAHLEKKKRKRKSEDVEDKNVLELGQDAECETKEVVKRKKTKSVEWDEEQVDETGAEEEIAEDGAEVVAKKKNRKRKKKHKKDKQDVESSRLQILSKREWKRLRNKYLDLQKGKMKCLKQYLGRNRWNNRHYDRFQHANGQNQEKEDHGDENSEIVATVKESEKKPRFTFTPGVIVHAMLDEPVTELRKFKVDAKALGDVEYVDIVLGANEAFLRCATPTAAEQLVTKAPWQQVEILKGDDESRYWNKMTEDREQKFSKNIRVKQRGRDKILRRAERELGKHIRFDE